MVGHEGREHLPLGATCGSCELLLLPLGVHVFHELPIVLERRHGNLATWGDVRAVSFLPPLEVIDDSFGHGSLSTHFRMVVLEGLKGVDHRMIVYVFHIGQALHPLWCTIRNTYRRSEERRVGKECR